jgi:hypothetical protein
MSVRGAATRLIGVFATAVLAVALVAGPAGAQAGERVRAFDVAIEVAPDGTMQVVETITYDFGANSRRGIYRIIPVRYDLPAAVTFDLPEGATPADLVRALDLDAIRVSSDTAPDDVQIEGPGLHASGGATTSIRIGDEDVFITGVHTYTISYRVDGALNGFGGDPPELSWDATGDGWAASASRAASGAPTARPTCATPPPSATGRHASPRPGWHPARASPSSPGSTPPA